jgi:demethylmenaquinone methyltransferase / 2-methoxy-6-polyprenyl-1,4-benzoquinol methylase
VALRADPGGTPSDRVRHARRLFAGIAERYDLMSEVLSYGRNRAWRRFLVSRVPPGSRVLDVATGTAGVAIELVRRRGAVVVGLDQSEPMLREGARRIATAGLGGRARLLLGRAERLPFPPGAFDALTFTYLLRYVDDPEAVLSELARVVRPGGVVASLEFGVPRHPVWRAGWRIQTRVGLPALGALASHAWRETGAFLGPSVEAFRREWPVPREMEAWRAAGLRDVRAQEFTFGAGVVLWARR